MRIYLRWRRPGRSVRVMRWFFLLIVSASAVWAQPLVNIDTVLVRDTNNTLHSSGSGAVAYPYRMGKYEVTIGQYTAFLNSVAATDTYGLYDLGMQTDLNVAGIARSGVAGAYSYSATGPNRNIPHNASSPGNRPIAYVSWFDAARFCNWLHNGATNGANTEDGAYTLNGAISGAIARNPSAKWWIPTADEWVKAGYYKGGGTDAGYWLYPTQSDVAPSNMGYSDSVNSANYLTRNVWSGLQPAYAVTWSSTYYADQNYLTDVGGMNSPSAYGTFDQAGNVWEWTDSPSSYDATKLQLRGGSWINPASNLQIQDYNHGDQTTQFSTLGFRVASALPATPTLSIEQPLGLVLSNNAGSTSFGGALINTTATPLSYTLRNTGAALLSDLSVTVLGPDASSFVLTPPAAQRLDPDGSITFTVSFSPQAAGTNGAHLFIESNDTNNSPFVINLSGFGLAEDLDTDGDGLNDAAEFTMSDLGFDWQSSQPTLVTALYSNANRANLFTQSQYDDNRTNGQTDVMNNPAAFNLFDSTQYEAHRISGVAQGKAEVTSNPTAYSLFTESSIMDMNLGGLMLKKGTDANKLDLELTIETNDNLATDGWRVAERITLPVSMEGGIQDHGDVTRPPPRQKQFLRVRAGAPIVAPNVKMLAHPTLGNILTDGAGRVLYFFTSDTPGGNPMFSGSSWPYVSVPAAPKADASVTATIASSSFGRSNGPFLTINTRPAYTYAGDTTAGQATGHGAGWVWYTIKADGTINQ